MYFVVQKFDCSLNCMWLMLVKCNSPFENPACLSAVFILPLAATAVFAVAAAAAAVVVVVKDTVVFAFP